MTRIRSIATAALLVTMLTAVSVAVARTDHRAVTRTKVTAIFDDNGQKLVKPKRIFLTADAGPYLTHLTWKGWGTAKATATGTYVSTCASCAPPRHRTATVVLSDRITCPTIDGFSYKRGTFRTLRDESTTVRRTVPFPTGQGVFCHESTRGG